MKYYKLIEKFKHYVDKMDCMYHWHIIGETPYVSITIVGRNNEVRLLVHAISKSKCIRVVCEHYGWEVE